MSQRGVRHGELGLAAGAALLAGWVQAGGMALALAALLAALLTLAVALRGRRWTLGVAALPLVLGAVEAALAAHRIRAVETRWVALREELVEEARRRLDRALGEAVDLARGVAERAAAVGDAPADQRFRRLDQALGRSALERGVVLFDAAGRPVAWAGRHRLPTRWTRQGLDARIAPFYAVLTAARQHGPWRAVSQVLLAADSTVPDRERSVAVRFARQTGVQLDFYAPRQAPAAWTDVFDYCLPSCRAAGVVPDTLFSVRAVPPSQGERKLAVLAVGRRGVVAATTLALILLVLWGSAPARYTAAVGLVAWYLLAPAGEYLGLGGAFDPATYFVGALGPAGASSGALAASAALAAALAVSLVPRLRVARGPALGTAALVVLVTPGAMAGLARGISLRAGGSPVELWVLWEGGLFLAGAGLLSVAWALRQRARAGPSPRWPPAWSAGAAIGWAALVAVAGLWVWSPGGGWPAWLLAGWIPAFWLAIEPGRPWRTVALVAATAGPAAALLTWGAVVEGRLVLADRDLARLGAPVEPVAEGLLDRLGSELEGGPVPTSAAALYRAWRHSALAGPEAYPVVLASWDAAGGLRARLDLAELDLPTPLLQALARSAVRVGEPVVERLWRTPGAHYVLSVPFPDGSAVTVGVGPRSRVFAPIRVAQFLRGERVTAAPYEVSLAEPFRASPAPAAGWRREGWLVRREGALGSASGLLHVHLHADLGEPSQLVVRGALLVLGDLLLVALVWGWGAALVGGWKLPRIEVARWRLRSYRARLALVLSVFFVVPTVAFAGWGLARVRRQADGEAQLLARQTLRDAAVAAQDLGPGVGIGSEERVRELANRLGADLLLYQAGELTASSLPVLEELGLVDRYLPPEIYRRLLLQDELEAAGRVVIAGRSTQVSYRTLGRGQGRPVVLGAPRLVDDAELAARRQDLVFTLILATLAGVAAAAWLARVAARALARPVHLLREAAVAVGRGEPVPAGSPAVPAEFVPVVEGLERMARDVRASQAALEAAQQRTEAVLRSVATGVVAVDRELRVVLANPRAEELLGARLPAGGAVRALTGEDWQSLWEWVAGFLAGGREPEAHELAVGNRRIRAQVAPLGVGGGCVVALDDTTDLAHAVRVLAWGELARQIAHEIKNPLTPVRLGIQHLERAYRDQREDYAQTLRRTARQILAEIERLDSIARAFARFGAPPAEAGPLAVVELVEAARETAALYALGGGAQVVVEGAEPVYGRVRRDEFKEVLINLVENARAAGASRIRIQLGRAAHGARISVVDDGRGIAPEHLPRIFEPQFSTTTSGAGLGLAICKRLVESWGGSIGVDSRLGEGTAVHLAVPSA